MNRRLVALVLVLALASSCSRTKDRDDAYRLELDGRATIVSGGDERAVDDGDHTLAAGDEIRVTEGDAVLEIPGDPEVLLRAGTTVIAGRVPEVVDGDAVVVGDVRFIAGDVEAVLADDGAARVSRALGVTIAIYRGSADVRAVGRPFRGGLGALRQLTVPATGLLPRAPVPLVYDPADPDPWDRLFLGDAIDLGYELDRLSRGFTSQLDPRIRVGAELLRDVLPSLDDDPEFDRVEVRDGLSAGESLIGAAIAVESSRGDLPSRWEDVFGFRADGATWGLVALDQEVRRDALRGRLDDAIDRSPLLFAAGSRPIATTTTTSTTTTQAPPPGSTTTTTEPDDPDDPIIPPPTVPPPTLPPLDPEDPPDDPAELIEDLIDDVLP